MPRLTSRPILDLLRTTAAGLDTKGVASTFGPRNPSRSNFSGLPGRTFDVSKIGHGFRIVNNRRLSHPARPAMNLYYEYAGLRFLAFV